MVIFIIIVIRIIKLDSTSAHEFAVRLVICHSDVRLCLRVCVFFIFMVFFHHMLRLGTELIDRTQFLLRYGGVVDDEMKCVEESRGHFK
jgi:hypothetical protein